jgi:4a-hydroxytetrahydrobiopterin dehydratase
MTSLARQRCEACNAGTPRIQGEELERLRSELDPDWSVDGERLRRRFEFPDFVRAFSRASAVALIAESAGHHPDIKVGWGYLDIELTTHAIGGISRNDFIVAARIDALER